MTAPEAFVKDLRKACGKDLDAKDILRSITELVNGHEYRDYLIWTGPAWGDSDLLLDVNILSEFGVYGFSLRNGNVSGASCSFFDMFENVLLFHMPSEHSAYVIELIDKYRIYGKAEDKDRVAEFFRKIIQGRIESKSRGG